MGVYAHPIKPSALLEYIHMGGVGPHWQYSRLLLTLCSGLTLGGSGWLGRVMYMWCEEWHHWFFRRSKGSGFQERTTHPTSVQFSRLCSWGKNFRRPIVKGGDDRDGAPLLFCADKECYQDLTEGRILDLGGGSTFKFCFIRVFCFHSGFSSPDGLRAGSSQSLISAPSPFWTYQRGVQPGH